VIFMLRGIAAIFFLFMAWFILNMMGMVGPEKASVRILKHLGLDAYLQSANFKARTVKGQVGLVEPPPPVEAAKPPLCERLLQGLHEAGSDLGELRFYEIRLLARHEGLKEHKHIKQLVRCFPKDPLGSHILELDLFSGDMSSEPTLDGQDIQLQMSVFDYLSSNKVLETTLALTLDELDGLGN
jgi:hypothetical protein